jgi:similar to stage IV sporulation protein
LNQKYEKIMATLEEKGVQIIGKDVKIETNDSKWVLKGILRVQENACESISIEEEFWEEETVEKEVSGENEF